MTITNDNEVDADIVTIGAAVSPGTGNLAVVNNASNCLTPILGPGESCTVEIEFQANTPGDFGVQVSTSLADEAMESSDLVSVTAVIGTLQVTPGDVSFPDTEVGLSSLDSVTLQNIGNGPLSISSISTSGDFSQTNSCPSSLAAGNSCNVSLAFMPTLVGIRTGQLNITAGGSPAAVALDGTGLPSSAAFSLDSGLPPAFPPTIVGGVGSTQSIVVSNLGASPLTNVNVSLGAAAPLLRGRGNRKASSSGPFSETNDCPTTLNAEESCTITATFSPTSAGTFNAALNLSADQDFASLPLSGQGLMGQLSVNPTSIDFADTNVGDSSSTLSVTVSNDGDAPLTLQTFDITGDFAIGNNTCPTILNSLESCSVDIAFSPTAAGARSGQFSVNSDVGAASVALTGTGLMAELSVDPTSLDFAATNVGDTSATLSVTLSNDGNAPLTLQSFDITGDFAIGNNTCPAVLNSLESCSVDIAFSPTAVGARNGQFSISTDIGAASVALTGTGLMAELSVDPTNLSFPETVVGATNATLNLTVSNDGNAPLTLQSFDITGDFAIGNNTCPAVLNSLETCSVGIAFTPTAAGIRNGQLTLNSGIGPATVALTGTGLIGTLSVEPTTLSFPTTTVGFNSAGQGVTVSNVGNAPLPITAISISGDFAQSSSCPAILNSAESCSINVVFVPTAQGSLNGQLTVTSDVGSAAVALSGQGVLPAPPPVAEPILQVSPAGAADFSGVAVGQISSARTFSVQNVGTAPLLISNLSASGPFTQTNSCGGALAPSAGCSVSVVFTPTTAGDASGSLNVASDGGSASVPLSGTGLQASLQTGSGGAVTFPDTELNATTSVGPITVTNAGNAPADGLTVVLTGGAPQASLAKAASGAFSEANGCPASLAPGQSCSVTLSFSPTVPGTYAGQLQISYSGGASSLALSATALGGLLSVSPGSLSFPETTVLASSDPLTATISNLGNAPLALNAIAISGDFAQTNNCPSSLGAGASCNANIVFTPSSDGARQGEFSVTTNFGSASIALDGSGDQPEPEEILQVLKVFAGNDPDVLSTVGAISQACSEEGISVALRQDCQSLLVAATNGDPNTAQALREITPERGVQHPRLIRNGAISQFQNLSARLAELRNGGSNSINDLVMRFGDESISGAQVASLVKAMLGGGAGDDEVAFPGSRWGVFLNGSISSGEKDETNLQSGLDFKTRGITLGADYRFNDRFVAGAAIGYMTTDSDTNGNRGGVEADGYSLSVYGSYYTDYASYVDFSALVGRNDFEQDRRIVYQLQGQAPVDQTAMSDFDGTFYGLSLSGGYDFQRGGWSFGPRGGLEYLKTKSDAYTETVSDPNGPGAGWAARIGETEQEFVTLHIGGRAAYAMSMSWGVLVPYVQIDWLHEFADNANVVTGRFVQDVGENNFGIETDEPDRNYFRLSLGGAATFADGLAAFIDFQTLLGSDLYQSSAIAIGVRAEY